MPTMIELFSGSGKMSRGFENLGYDVFTIDINPDCEPDLIADINDIGISDIPDKFHNPDVIWCGLDCTYWSRANNQGNHLGKGGKILSSEARKAEVLAKHTLKIIDHLKPRFWFVENPGGNGGLKQQSFMKKYPMVEIYYCQYGANEQKPTVIFGKFPSTWNPKTVCSCVRHSGNVEDKLRKQLHRSAYPNKLIIEITEACLISKTTSWLTLEAFI